MVKASSPRPQEIKAEQESAAGLVSRAGRQEE
jgi:hypothetical protein